MIDYIWYTVCIFESGKVHHLQMQETEIKSDSSVAIALLFS